jgi:hypothetical protein
MNSHAVEYSLLKWLRANDAPLSLLSGHADLKPYVEPALDLHRNLLFDIEALNREFASLQHGFGEQICTCVSALVRKLYDGYVVLAEQDRASVVSLSGIDVPGLAFIRMDLYEWDAGGNDWVARGEHSKTIFDRHARDWTVRLEADGLGQHYTIRCTVEPAALGQATLHEQFVWMEADLKASRGEIYAIIRDPKKWPVRAVTQVDPKSVVEGLAARFLSSISAEERVQLRGYTNAFCERIKTLLGV